jgi:hypothetical protein
LSGVVSWGASPLPGARVVALLLGDGIRPKSEDLSTGSLSLPVDQIFESADETNADGRFSLTLLVPGVYTVLAYHPDIKYAKGSAPVDLREATSADVDIRFKDAYIVLDVRDEDTGEPIIGAQATVKSRKRAGDVAPSGTFNFESDRDGLVRVADLFKGPLDVQVSAAGYRGKRIETSPATSLPVVPRRVSLVKTSACDLRLLDESGAPLAGARAFAVGAEASQTIFPELRDLGSADESGYVSVDRPSDGFPHLVSIAAGRMVKFIPNFFAAGGCGQADLILSVRQRRILPQVKTSQGQAFAGAKIALVTGGLFIPWNLLAQLAALEGSAPTGLITTNGSGEIQLAATLEDGFWDAYAFSVDGGVELKRKIGSFELPLSSPITIVVTGGRKR